MSASVVLQESEVRQAIASSLKSALAVPLHTWSEEFVAESVLSELITPSSSDGNNSRGSADSRGTAELYLPLAVASTSSSKVTRETAIASGISSSNKNQAASHQRASRKTKEAVPAAAAAAAAVPAAQAEANRGSRNGNRATSSSDISAGSNDNMRAEVLLAPDICELLDQYIAAAAATGSADEGSKRRAKANSNANSSSSRQRSSPGAMADVCDQMQQRLSQLLYDNYTQVDDEDVSTFCFKLLCELQQLVSTALAQQEDDSQGLCALCERDMPLTKHHLIPRDVHKEFKKRGFGFDELQAGLMVCRPCHSAIHRAVPDNKQLALHYRTLETLSQHEDIARFATWARRQRVSSRVDATSRHFRYRR